MDIYCKVTPYGFVPLHDSDYELKKRMKQDTVVRCRISLPRNYEFHKKFFALVRLTFENLSFPLVKRWNIRNENDMLRRFKRDLGYFKTWANEYGEVEIEYQSISFSAMDETEFEKFYNDCVDLVLSKYIPGIGREDLLEEVERFK